jgi:hypothetical protein
MASETRSAVNWMQRATLVSFDGPDLEAPADRILIASLRTDHIVVIQDYTANPNQPFRVPFKEVVAIVEEKVQFIACWWMNHDRPLTGLWVSVREGEELAHMGELHWYVHYCLDVNVTDGAHNHA